MVAAGQGWISPLTGLCIIRSTLFWNFGHGEKALKWVGMVVWNTFETDARVLKEAQTLTAAGYEVTVCALH